MSNVKFTQLPNLGNITPTTIVPVVAANVNYTVTAANLQSYVNSTTGNITAGNVTATGNITGSYILGNGSQLTGLPQQYGNANVSAYLPTYTGNLSPGNLTVSGQTTLGNISIGSSKTIDAGNNIIGNVANPIASDDVATKAYVDTEISADYFSITDGIVTEGIAKGDTMTIQGSVNEVSVILSVADTFTIGLPNDVTVTGNLSANSLSSNSTLSVTGNVTAGNVTATKFFGDGSALTGITANVALQGNLQGNLSGNGFGANAFTFVSATGNVTAGNLVTAGNVTANYVKGNGTELTGIVNSILAGTGISISAATGNVTITNNNPTPYANANVSNFLANFGSNVVSTTGNITAGNISATGRISATGNVQGAFILGNASQATGIPTSIAAGTGISVNAATGAVTVTNAGVTGLTAGSGISLSGSTGNVTITATGAGNSSSITNGQNFIDTNYANGRLIINGGNSLTGANAVYNGLQANIIAIRNNNSGAAITITDDPTTRIVLNGNGGEINIGSGSTTRIATMIGTSATFSQKVTAQNVSNTAPFNGTLSTKTGASTGTAGDIAWDNNYIYVCVSTNTWKRVALSAF